MKLKNLTLTLALALGLNYSAQAADLNELASYAKIDKQSLEQALKQATYQQKIIDAITRPSEGKPWYQYRKIFITQSRINAGVQFWLDNEETLKRAEEKYNVPSEIICAIIGVETFFGKNMGSWKVLDALYTLGFNYPKREAYFSKEFARFVALAQREQWSYDEIKGSYAGAMGMGQFMPSAYLDYAVDFDGDGKVNLFYNKQDAIGSVANYFKGHGWLANKGVFYLAHTHNQNVQALMKKGWDLTTDELLRAGVTTKVNLSKGQKARLFAFDLEDGSKSYAVGLNNFNTIMRYNTSPMYARAVYELSEFIYANYAKYKQQQGIIIQRRSREP